MMKMTEKDNGKNRKRTGLTRMLATLFMVAVMIISAGCGKSFDASGYVKSFMDMLTKGDVKEYMKFTGQSEEEALEDYDKMTQAMMETMGNMGLSEEMQQRYVDFFKEILAKSKYTVGEAVEKEDGYQVDVTIEPMTGLYDGLGEELQQDAIEYSQQLSENGEIDTAAYQEWVFERLLTLLEERKDSIGYGEPTTVTVEIEKDGDNYKIKDEYEIGGEIGAALIDTTGLN